MAETDGDVDKKREIKVRDKYEGMGADREWSANSYRNSDRTADRNVSVIDNSEDAVMNNRIYTSASDNSEETVIPGDSASSQADSSEYDTDLDNNTNTGKNYLENNFGRGAYRAACDELHIVPAKRVLRNLENSELSLKYRSTGPDGAKALAAALIDNACVEVLNLEENGLGGKGAMHIADMLRENLYITELNLSKNDIRGLGAITFGEMLRFNTTLTHLNLSDNNFKDVHADHIAAGLQRNDRLKELVLSYCDFSVDGPQFIGIALSVNSTLEHLDLSWCHIRRKGAVMLCNGLKINTALKSLNVAWNGFGYEGALAVGDMLKVNTGLRHLDLSNNRIMWEGTLLLAAGLKINAKLQVLKIGGNPLTTTGVLDMIETIKQSRRSALEYLGLDNIAVNNKIVYTVETIQKQRPFSIVYGRLIDGEDVFGKRLVNRGDPLRLLIQYLSDKNIRVVDLFRLFDKDCLHRVSCQNFIRGLKRAKVPLDDDEIQRVVDKLDKNAEGKISYQELAKGVRDQIIQNRADDRKRELEQKKLMEEHKRILNPLLPPISERHLYGALLNGPLALKRSETISSASTHVASVAIQNHDRQNMSPWSNLRQNSSRLRQTGQQRSSAESNGQSHDDEILKLLPRISLTPSAGAQERISSRMAIKSATYDSPRPKRKKKRKKKKD